MIRVDVRVDISNALKKFDLTEADAKNAIPRALNKTGTSARAQAARQIRDAGYGIKVSDVKAAINIRKATPQEMRALVVAVGRPIPLVQYGARQTTQGVSVKVLNGRAVIKSAFIATMPNGHRGVFIRVNGAQHARAIESKLVKLYGGKRKGSYGHGLPIRQLFGPSIPTAFENDAVRSATEQADTVRRQQSAQLHS